MEQSEFKKSHFICMMIFFVAACVFLMFGYFASEGFAQRSYQQTAGDNQGERDTTDHFSRIDTDGDGRISQEEFRGPDEHFVRFDKDNDGYLNENELPDRPPRGKNGKMRGPKSFSRLDKDSDGKLSLEEFPGPDEHFSQFDADNDGYLSEDEMPKGPPRRNQKSYSAN